MLAQLDILNGSGSVYGLGAWFEETYSSRFNMKRKLPRAFLGV